MIDLWSEDTKQDAWFSQSAMDVGFRWMEKELTRFRVYLFSGECSFLFAELAGSLMVVQMAPDLTNMTDLIINNQ